MLLLHLILISADAGPDLCTLWLWCSPSLTGANIPLAQIVVVTSCNLRWWCCFIQPLVQIVHLHTWCIYIYKSYILCIYRGVAVQIVNVGLAQACPNYASDSRLVPSQNNYATHNNGHCKKG